LAPAFPTRRSSDLISQDGLRRLGPRPMALLMVLAGQPGKVLSREELMVAVWSGVVVSDETLSRCISDLRQALDDDPRSPRYIETLARRGYRLLERPSPLIDSRQATSEAEVAATALQGKRRPQLRIRQRGPWLVVSTVLMLAIVAGLLMTDSSDRAPTLVNLAENGIAVLPF